MSPRDPTDAPEPGIASEAQVRAPPFPSSQAIRDARGVTLGAADNTAAADVAWAVTTRLDLSVAVGYPPGRPCLEQCVQVPHIGDPFS